MAKGINELTQTGRADVDGRPAKPDAVDGAGSKSQLGLRLEKLPAGHPSSPKYSERASDGSGARGEPAAETRAVGVTEETAEPPSSDEPAPPEEPPLPGSPPIPSGPSPDALRVGYSERIPQFDLMWSWHEVRWPGRPEASEGVKSGDPPGSWRGDGHRTLGPERNAEADWEIAALHSHEKGITETLKRIEQGNTYGGTLAGLEYRLKGENRIKEKIYDGVSKEAGATVADAAGEVWDAVRYTFELDANSYVRGHDDLTLRLESAGYRLVQRENNWSKNSEYKGINTRWLTPDGGRFELQFHTPESLDAKENRTHRAYDRLRSGEVSRPEERDLHGYQAYVSAAIPWPPGVEVVPDYKERT